MPRLEAFGTTVPGHRVLQTEMRDLAKVVLAEHAPLLERLTQVFDNSGIRERYFVEELGWYLEPRGWRERQALFAQHAVPLAQAASKLALERASLTARDVDAVVFVSTTGIATPSPEARLANAMGLRPDVVRVPVWGLGCAGGVAGLARARDLALARPDSRTLVVALEICSLAFQFGEFNKKVAVAASLFGDGAAAAIVAGDNVDARGPRITATQSHLFAATERVMGWDVEDYGLGVVFSPEIPAIVEREMEGLASRFLKAESDGTRPARWLFHPGGAKVLSSYEKALGITPADLPESYGVLRDYGNMSSPTVLFVAERGLRERPLRAGERALLSSFGPGFAGEMALLEG